MVYYLDWDLIAQSPPAVLLDVSVAVATANTKKYHEFADGLLSDAFAGKMS